MTLSRFLGKERMEGNSKKIGLLVTLYKFQLNSWLEKAGRFRGASLKPVNVTRGGGAADDLPDGKILNQTGATLVGFDIHRNCETDDANVSPKTVINLSE